MALKKILITGTTGFMGSRLVGTILQKTSWEIFSLERITHRPNQLGDLQNSPRIHRLYHDFRAELPQRILEKCDGVDYIIHCGAEVHGPRSLEDPELFVNSNLTGTFNMLEAARILKPRRFLYVSSALAVGETPKDGMSWDESAPLRPSNPYAAAKAAGEMICQSYYSSFGVPVLTVRTMNVFGEKQDTSKFVPMVIKKVLNNEPVTCHVNSGGESGSRRWIYVQVLADVLLNLLHDGRDGEVYHIVGPEMSNLEIIRKVEFGLSKKCDLRFIQPGAGYDIRYSLVDTKIQNYDVRYTERHLLDTISWYRDNPEWLT